MSKLKEAFVKKTTRVPFIPFITAGYPTEEATIELASLLEKEGAIALELGVPYSDPLADGPVIQFVSQEALKQGMNVEKAIDLVKKMRNQGIRIPIILFSYYNPVLRRGISQLLSRFRNAGGDGVIIPDLPVEESKEFIKACHQHALSFIPLVAPTSKQRIEKIVATADSFVYCVSSLGVTGERKTFNHLIDHFIRDVREHTLLPLAVGFGISTREQVEQLIPMADGLIIGSALLKKIIDVNEWLSDEEKKEKGYELIKKFLQELFS
ncbi:tryptophan synthase subunit alpha [Microaerobacter geothermalis]|uniref:tryptophan synthase subunit alpha n=1 Tax=Microaerobacter geothermalis TaxID=674972 RepID=UPI001F2020DF|nr:tryptophan synthase subunit alpha [Microaerobacter geothermalis]MCF6093375.1 tryptophan synthase subunit alpha [Microaerobacter geothermalis]